MALWTRWAPPLERSRLMTFSGSGANFGAFVALPLTGYICQTLGWPTVFYICGEAGKRYLHPYHKAVSNQNVELTISKYRKVNKQQMLHPATKDFAKFDDQKQSNLPFFATNCWFVCFSGGVGCIWAVFWFVLVSNDPRTHRWISHGEREYIINSIGPQVHMKHFQTGILSYFSVCATPNMLSFSEIETSGYRSRLVSALVTHAAFSSSVGHHYHPDVFKLVLLHSAHLPAHLHGQHLALWPEIGEF